MTRASTDTYFGQEDLPFPDWEQERAAMKSLGIWLCVAFTVWMIACGLVLFFAGDIARFIVGHSA